MSDRRVCDCGRAVKAPLRVSCFRCAAEAVFRPFAMPPPDPRPEDGDGEWELRYCTATERLHRAYRARKAALS